VRGAVGRYRLDAGGLQAGCAGITPDWCIRSCVCVCALLLPFGGNEFFIKLAFAY
jgi:hypothetical protein